MSIFLAPKFLLEYTFIILAFSGPNDTNVTVSLLWPKSTNATTLGDLALNSFYLKNPYERAVAVPSFINWRHPILAILTASKKAYLSRAVK